MSLRLRIAIQSLSQTFPLSRCLTVTRVGANRLTTAYQQ